MLVEPPARYHAKTKLDAVAPKAKAQALALLSKLTLICSALLAHPLSLTLSLALACKHTCTCTCTCTSPSPPQATHAAPNI